MRAVYIYVDEFLNSSFHICHLVVNRKTTPIRRDINLWFSRGWDSRRVCWLLLSGGRVIVDEGEQLDSVSSYSVTLFLPSYALTTDGANRNKGVLSFPLTRTLQTWLEVGGNEPRHKAVWNHFLGAVEREPKNFGVVFFRGCLDSFRVCYIWEQKLRFSPLPKKRRRRRALLSRGWKTIVG